MKKYGLKYFIFLAPFLTAIFIELFCLPIDFFTFRVWETLITKHSYGILKGSFYPNMSIVKTEEGGDLKPPPCCAVKKKNVIWQTDAYGYRKADSPVQRYPIIIVGDSNTAGSGLSQSEILSEVLEKRLGKSVYPLASESLKDIFENGLLKQTKPDVVILENGERGILTGNFMIPRNADFQKLSAFEVFLWSIRLHPTVQSIAVKIDRMLKANMLHYIRSRINSKKSSETCNATENNCPVLFLQGAAANKYTPDDLRLQVAQKIKQCSDFFANKGIRFIFLPIPNKETIYYRELGTSKPVFLEKLIKDLRTMGVEVIDIQKAFDDVTHQKVTHLYHRDDTHWNAEGVKITATLLEETLRKQK